MSYLDDLLRRANWWIKDQADNCPAIVNELVQEVTTSRSYVHQLADLRIKYDDMLRHLETARKEVRRLKDELPPE